MTQTNATRAADSTSVLRQYVSAVESGDEKAMRDLFAEDAGWTLAAGKLPISGTWKGRDAILNDFLAAALSHYEPGSVQLEITGMTCEDDRAVLQWTSRARTRDGRPYENECIGVFTIRDGKIYAVREFMDTLYASDTAFGRPHESTGHDPVDIAGKLATIDEH
jgi:uncharacterized protein